jgi:hypothetical protein
MRLTLCFTTFLLILPAGAPNLSAAQNGPGVPVLGLAYDFEFDAIRPILGIPGAAIIGDAIDFGFPIATAVISPQNSRALVVSAGDQTTRLVQFQAGVGTALTLNAAMTSPSLILFSPSGYAAVLYQQASHKLQLVTGLPANPAVQDISLSGVPDSAGPAAISDDGQLILLTSPGQDARQVWLLPVAGNPMLLPFPGSILTFRPMSHDALTATPAGVVYLVRDVVQSVDYKPIFAGSNGASNPVAVAFSSDGSLGYVADASGALTVIDLTSSVSNTIDCGCAPTLLQPVSASSMFRVSEISNTPVLLFEGSATASRTWFVPARPRTAKRRPVEHRGGVQ